MQRAVDAVGIWIVHVVVLALMSVVSAILCNTHSWETGPNTVSNVSDEDKAQMTCQAARSAVG